MLSRIVRSLTQGAPDRVAKAPVFERLEERQLMAVSPVIAGTKIKGINLSSGGVSTNQTLITIPFTGNINLVDDSKIQLRGYAINPLTGGQVKKVINVVSASVLAAPNDQYLQITTDVLMRKGGAINLLEGALQDDNGNVLATQNLKAVKGQNKERFTLARRAFIPTDINKFADTLYSGASAPVTPSAVSDSAVLSALTTFLQKKVDLALITTAQRDAALTRYNSSATIGIIPSANLRAALVSLVGTLAEGAIACYLDGNNNTGKPYTILSFDNPPDPNVPVAQSILNTSTNRLRTVVKPEFANEDFRGISAFLAHEALHQDNVNGLQEEIFAVTVETLTYSQQAQVDNSFLAAETKLVKFENQRLAALIQSGRTIFPYVGLFNGPNHFSKTNIFPNSITPSGGAYISYEDMIRREYVARGALSQVTSGNSCLRSYYTNVTGKAAAANMSFTGSLLTDVDSFQAPLGTKAAIQLAGALKMALA